MSRQQKFLVGGFVIIVALGIFFWSQQGRNILGGNYGTVGTTVVKTP